MIETFLFGIVLQVNNNKYLQTMESIIEDKGFFMKYIQLIIVDTMEEPIDKEVVARLEEEYMGNIIYTRRIVGNAVEVYNIGMSYCKAKYITFVDADMVYGEGTLKEVKCFCKNQAVDIIGIHTLRVDNEKNRLKKNFSRKNRWNSVEKMLLAPIYIHQYLFRYNKIKEKVFRGDKKEKIVKEILLHLLEQQGEIVLVGNTMLYCNKPREKSCYFNIEERCSFWNRKRYRIWIDRREKSDIEVKRIKGKWCSRKNYFYMKGLYEFIIKIVES